MMSFHHKETLLDAPMLTQKAKTPQKFSRRKSVLNPQSTNRQLRRLPDAVPEARNRVYP
jgi:hypothetical protein